MCAGEEECKLFAVFGIVFMVILFCNFTYTQRRTAPNTTTTCSSKSLKNIVSQVSCTAPPPQRVSPNTALSRSKDIDIVASALEMFHSAASTAAVGLEPAFARHPPHDTRLFSNSRWIQLEIKHLCHFLRVCLATDYLRDLAPATRVHILAATETRSPDTEDGALSHTEHEKWLMVAKALQVVHALDPAMVMRRKVPVAIPRGKKWAFDLVNRHIYHPARDLEISPRQVSRMVWHFKLLNDIQSVTHPWREKRAQDLRPEWALLEGPTEIELLKHKLNWDANNLIPAVIPKGEGGPYILGLYKVSKRLLGHYSIPLVTRPNQSQPRDAFGDRPWVKNNCDTKQHR